MVSALTAAIDSLRAVSVSAPDVWSTGQAGLYIGWRNSAV